MSIHFHRQLFYVTHAKPSHHRFFARCSSGSPTANMPFFNSQGHNWGSTNLDGWAMTQIAFALIYTVCFITACIVLWRWRNHSIIKMRDINLTLISLAVLHAYLLMVLIVYSMNGAFPCQAEFWIMSLYLPGGIGLFQAQNQQLSIVSREQIAALTEDTYKLLGPRNGGAKNWQTQLRAWNPVAYKKRTVENLAYIGIAIQVCHPSS